MFSSSIFPVCSPALLVDGKPFESPEELKNQTLLQVYPSEKDWYTWLRKNNLKGLDPNSGLLFDSYEMAWNAAMQGQGVALGMEPFVTRDIEAGLFVEPCPGRRVRTRGDWNLVYRKESANMERIAKFRAWLLKEVDKDGTTRALSEKADASSFTPRTLSAVK